MMTNNIVFREQNIQNNTLGLYGDGVGYVSIVNTLPQVGFYEYYDDDGNIVGTINSIDAQSVLNARVSFNNGLREYEKDKKRLESIVKYGHLSCLDQINLQFSMKIPLFAARQFERHTMKINELSRRFTSKDIEFFVPNKMRRQNTKGNKQGSYEDESLDHYRDIMLGNIQKQIELYYQMIDDGVARELARIILPQSLYTVITATFTLRDFLYGFIRQRVDNHAQLEIQELAKGMLELSYPLAPLTIDYFFNYNMNV